jgi:elongation factor 1-gamma
LKLVGYKFSPSTQSVLAIAKFANAPVTLDNINWGDAKREELKKNSPTATFPYLETSQGVISETRNISEFLAESFNAPLLGNTPFERAQVRQWIDFAANEIARHSKNLIYPLFGFVEYNKQEADQSMKDVKEWLKVLEKQLQGKQYIVGNNVTLADLALHSVLRSYFMFVFVEEIRKSLFPSITAWITNLASSEHLTKVFGRFLLCKTPQKAPKIEKPKEEPKKKEEPKPKATEATGEEEAPKKKKANPLDLLPPTEFVLDDFKKEFLNTTEKKAVMDRFWNKFDANGYSLWWMQYQKLPSEGKILFKTNNSSSFFLQKLDSFRKYSFSAHGVYGTEGNYEIRGVWMWRGTDIPEEVKNHDSFPYMDIKKLDPSKPEDRKLVEDYWLNLKEGDMVDVLPVAELVTFKKKIYLNNIKKTYN